MQERIENGICTFCGTKKGFTQEPPFALPAGSILHGRYLTGAVLGHGGFGITYIAMDLKANQRVGIKEFMPDGLSTRIPGTTTITVHSNSEDYYYGRKQFLEEARTIYKYKDNPNIISVSALFEENNTAYYVMEHLDGCDLKRYLSQRGGKIPFGEAKRLLDPVLNALSAVHKQNIIHRDVSPDNIFICKNGQTKLLDFGAARVALIGKSKSMSIILKRGYAPEEQYRSHGEQGPWTDTYALAATLYKCITGQIPPEATERLYRDELPPPATLCSDLPEHAERAIIKALSVKAEYRYQTIDEFKSALGGTLMGASKNQYSNPQSPSQKNCTPQGESSIAGRRIAALLIDGVLIYLLNLVLLQFFTINIAGYYIFAFLVSFLYGHCLEASDLRGTIGKKLLGIQVSDSQGLKLDPGKVLIRNLIKYCPSALMLFLPYYIGGIFALLNYGTALFNPKHQALHDMAADSIVTGRYILNRNIYENNYAVNTNKSAYIQCVSGYFAGSEFPMQDKVILGRNPNACNIIFPDGTKGVSKIHCQLYFDKNHGTITVIDLGSTYGTLAGNHKLSKDQSTALCDGDSFIIGDNNRFTVHIR